MFPSDLKKLLFFLLLISPLLLHKSSSGETFGYTIESTLEAIPGYGTVQKVNDPVLNGPDRLCNVFGSVLGTFSGGGDPETDLYQWTILDPQGKLLFTRPAGSFPTITYTFELLGTHKIELTVFRGGIPLKSFSKNVELLEGPKITLKSSYLICQGQEIDLQAIDPSSSNFSNYQFEWENESGAIIGTSNTLKTSVPGKYSVSFLFENSEGNPECETILETEVSESNSISIVSSAQYVCPDGSITFTSEPMVSGEWFLQKIGDPTLISLGSGNSKTINPILDLGGNGDYRVSLIQPNPNNPACIQKSEEIFTYNPLPEFELESSTGASACLEPDGAIRIRVLTPIDNLILEDGGQSFGPLNPGDVVEFSGLESGAYTFLGLLGGCSNTLGSVVPLIDPPAQLAFEISDIQSEYCTDTGKENGSFLVKLISGVLEGSYRIKTMKGLVVKNEALPLASEFRIEIPGGKYFFEVLDKDSCNLPKNEEFEVPSLSQVSFSIPDSLSICQSFEFSPQTTQALEFTLTFPDLTETVLPAGEAFTLTQAGIHTLVGRLPGQSELCPTLKEFKVKLVDPIEFEPKLISEDCTVGNRTYEADIFGIAPADAIFLWRNEKNEVIGTGQTLFLPPSAFGEYSLEVQPAESQSCPISPKKFTVKEPILSVDVSLESTKLCEYGPRAMVNLSTTFFEEVTDIEWRRYDSAGNIIDLPEFKDQTEITVDIAGIYEAAVFSRIPSIQKDCELGRSSIPINLVLDKVEFEVPSSLSICDPYQLIPQSAQNLEYSLTFPDGKTEIKNSGEAFTLDQEGTYTLLGYDPDISVPKCPEQKYFEVKINLPVEFEPVLVNIDCEGTYEYFAQVANYPSDSVDYLWRDPSGNPVSSTANLVTSTYGTFSLEVQPKGSIPCQIQPVSLEIPVPVLSVETKILADPLCPDQPNASLSVETDLSEISTIEWWFSDINNIRNQLTSETNKVEIFATSEGTYEVILKNQFGCFMGRDQVLVLRSSDQVRPIVEESYQVCPKYEIAPLINPGTFAGYEWYFGDNLVSTSPTFKPNQIGTYRVVVFSTEGCAYETSFETEEECELRVNFPNAIQPGNPDKPFLIYTNYLIDELEIWIFSKWGEVIFHCKNTQLISEESTCMWDGYFDGQKVPPGSYAYRINFKNLEKNIAKEQLGSILVIN